MTLLGVSMRDFGVLRFVSGRQGDRPNFHIGHEMSLHTFNGKIKRPQKFPAASYHCIHLIAEQINAAKLPAQRKPE